MVGVWLIVLASSSTPYGKVPRLIVKKTSRLTQVVVVSEGIFCAARCCVNFHLQSMKVYLHISNGNVQRNLLCAASVTKNLHISPRFWPTIFYQDARAHLCTAVDSMRRKPFVRFFYQDANSVLLLAHFCTAVLLGSIRKTLCLKLFMMRA